MITAAHCYWLVLILWVLCGWWPVFKAKGEGWRMQGPNLFVLVLLILLGCEAFGSLVKG